MINEKDRLGRLLFLEFDRDKAAEIFHAGSLKQETDELYVPVNPDFLVRQIKNDQVPEDLPVSEFIMGMAYALALDPQFTYSPDYLAMLKGFPDSEVILKKKAAGLLAENQKVEAYILSRGLYEVSGDEETENVLLSLAEELALKDPGWMDEAFRLTEQAMANKNLNAFLIRGSLERVQGNEAGALTTLREYLSMGGESTDELTAVMEELERNSRAEEAYATLYDEPKEALTVFLELLPREQDNVRLIYSIAVAYRLLGNHEKAILYLEDAQGVDPSYVDVQNEMGLNYALLEDYRTASGYFRAVYETTRDLAPLTNLIISLLNLGQEEEAMELYEEAIKMDPEDEILGEIRRIYLT